MPDSTDQNLTESQSRWLKTLQACKASGKTMKAFAASEELDLNELYTWKKVLVKKGVLPRTQKPRFQKVKIVDTGPVPECRILLPNGVAVILPGGLDSMGMTQLLRSAMQL